MMKHPKSLRALLAAAVLLLAAGVTADNADLQTAAKIESGKNGVWIKRGPTIVASVDKNVKVELEKGELSVDATEYKFAADGKDSVITRLFLGGDKKAMSGKKLTITITAAADRSADGVFYLEGNVKGKHFWRAMNVKLSDKTETYTFPLRLPYDVEKLWIRFDIKTPAVCRFTAATMELSKEEAIDSTANQVINGGAERGWYGTGATAMNLRSNDGKIRNWDGRIITHIGTWSLDNKVVHSGKYSFRGDGDPAGFNRLTLNPVRYIPGKPAHLSFWIKAAKPGTKINYSLFLASGLAYGSSATLGTEWQRLEINIPAWGEAAPGINRIGDVITGFGSCFEEVYPCFDPAGVVWLDDVCFTAGGDKTEFKDDAIIHVSGEMNKPEYYYRAGEPIKAALKIANSTADDRKVEISYQVSDFFGHKVMEDRLADCKLPANGQRQVDVALDLNRIGPLNLAFTLRDVATGKVFTHNFVFGIINPPGGRRKRLALDLSSQMNVKAMLPFLNDFRIGTVRLWSDYFKPEDSFSGLELVKPMKKAGIQILFNVGFNHRELLAPVDMRPWQEFLRRSFAPYKGMIDVYEILNEPNIWSGRDKIAEPNKFCEMNIPNYVRTLKAAAEVIREIDPKAKIAGPTTCHTDVVFTGNVIAAGGKDYLDIITEHPYRGLPELPDYETDLTSLKRLIEQSAGRAIPIWASEAGNINEAMLPNNLLNDKTRKTVSLSIRNMLVSFAGGNEVYVQFAAALWPEGTAWNSFFFGNPGNGCRPIPQPVLYAMRTIADILGNAKPIGRVKLGSDFRCYVFDRDDKRVVVFWKWNGKPVEVEVGQAEPQDKLYDLMGNPITGSRLDFNTFPTYLVTDRDLAGVKKYFAALQLDTGEAAVDATVDILSEKQYAVKVQNCSGKPVSGSVSVTAKNSAAQTRQFTDLAPEEFRSLTFNAPREINTDGQPIKAVVRSGDKEIVKRLTLKSMLCRKLTRPIKLDGDLSDWPQQNKVTLTAAANAVASDRKLWHPADQQIKAELMTAWDDDHFYVAVTVFKPKFYQNANSAAALWQGDSLQIALDPLKNALPNSSAYDDDDFEYSMGLLNGKPMVYRHYASSAVHDSLQKNKGELNPEEVKLVVKPMADRTVYEMAFSKLSISPFRLLPGSTMRWDIIINLNNGEGRMGWLELTPGIGGEKTPGQFMDIVLTP